MQDVQAIIKAYRAVEFDRRAALATVVSVSGSAYRRPGAKMLVLDDGTTVGTISGGCLETDVAIRARECIDAGKSLLLRYSTSGSDDVIFGVRLGCDGRVDILVEPLYNDSLKNPIRFLSQCISQRQIGVLATIFQIEGAAAVGAGDRLLVRSDGSVTGQIEDAAIASAIREDAGQVIERGQSLSKKYLIATTPAAVEAHVFFEFVQPPIHLILCGAGEDAIPIVHTAKQLGWFVTVIDSRAAHAVASRFPLADAVVCCSEEAALETIDCYRSAAVIMAHNYEHDLNYLRQLIASDLGYIGILGPKSRSVKLLSDLASSGTTISAEQADRLYAPVGLDIGAESAAEIALSVVSEVQAVYARRMGGYLRDRRGPIHTPSVETPSSSTCGTIEVASICQLPA